MKKQNKKLALKKLKIASMIQTEKLRGGIAYTYPTISGVGCDEANGCIDTWTCTIHSRDTLK